VAESDGVFQQTFSGLKARPQDTNQTCLKFSVEYRLNQKEMTPAKHVLSQAEGTQSAPSSEKQKNIFTLRPWRLGARKFLEVLLSNISNERIYVAR
jgi:hypothetical protein